MDGQYFLTLDPNTQAVQKNADLNGMVHNVMNNMARPTGFQALQAYFTTHETATG